MLTTEEILVTCPRCNGERGFGPRRIDTNTGSYGQRTYELEPTCRECNGSGKVLTEAGRRSDESDQAVRSH